MNCVADHSFSLQQDGSTKKPRACSNDPLSSKRTAKQFRSSLASSVKKLIQPVSNKDLIKSQEASTDLDTVVYPLVQMGYYGIRQDELATQRLLSSVDESDEVHLASGYFNLPPQYIDAIFRGRGRCHVLAASPQVCSNLDFADLLVMCTAMVVYLTNKNCYCVAFYCASHKLCMSISNVFFFFLVVLRPMVSMVGRAWQATSP